MKIKCDYFIGDYLYLVISADAEFLDEYKCCGNWIDFGEWFWSRHLRIGSVGHLIDHHGNIKQKKWVNKLMDHWDSFNVQI